MASFSKMSITKHPYTWQQKWDHPSMLKYWQKTQEISIREMKKEEQLCTVRQGKGRGKRQALLVLI